MVEFLEQLNGLIHDNDYYYNELSLTNDEINDLMSKIVGESISYGIEYDWEVLGDEELLLWVECFDKYPYAKVISKLEEYGFYRTSYHDRENGKAKFCFKYEVNNNQLKLEEWA